MKLHLSSIQSEDRDRAIHRVGDVGFAAIRSEGDAVRFTADVHLLDRIRYRPRCVKECDRVVVGIRYGEQFAISRKRKRL